MVHVVVRLLAVVAGALALDPEALVESLLEKLNGKMADYATYELLLEADAATDPVYEVAVDYSKYGTVKPPTEDRP